MPKLSKNFSRPQKRLRIAFIGSCLPRRCGIATFTANLSKALETCLGKGFSSYLALNDIPEGYDYSPKVIAQIGQENPEDYRRAAALVNASDVDLVSLQHEFGLFGGPDGNYITEFLSRVKKPIVTTLHTVMEEPTPGQRKTLIEIAAFSQTLVVMNALAIDILTTIYQINAEKIQLIPHGVPDTPYIDPLFYKHQLGLAEKQVILTFGFLSPNKGIETMLQALPAVVKGYPGVLYIILGVTHPVVKKRYGEVYRESLEKMVGELGLQKHVLFHNEFVDDGTLEQYLGAADLVVCPYHSGEQITSGVLSNALGKGKVIISTPYLHAREVLSEGRGRLVGFKDQAGLAAALSELLGNRPERLEMSRKSFALGREMTWSSVAQRYTALFEQVVWEIAQEYAHAFSMKKVNPTLPVLNLHFLRVLSENTGVLQHSVYGVPQYLHGYTTDDAARALVVCTNYHNLFYSSRDSVLPLVDRYLALLLYAQQENGWFANFMNYEGAFVDEKYGEDTLGRCLWGLGSTVCLCQSDEQDLLAKDLFKKTLPLVDGLTYTRSLAYSILGLNSYLNRFPKALEVQERLASAADQLLCYFKEHASPEWPWFEPFLTYDNARLSQAMLLAYHHLSQEKYLETGLQTLDFLTSLFYREGYFDLIGNQGWFTRGKERALFGQQPLDAGALVETYLLAFMLCKKEKYLEFSYAAFQWFLGRNRLGKNLYFPDIGACADGLDSHGGSRNRGAEATITFLMALLALYYWELRGRPPQFVAWQME